MEFCKTIEKEYLYFPVCVGEEEAFLEIFLGEEKIFEFKIPRKLSDEAFSYDYLATVPVKEYVGKKLIFKGEFPQTFFEVIDKAEAVECVDEGRPEVHFTANTGWINDPNGLIYDGEFYHLYFQYNPFNVTWANMSWGHAVSKDLMHWTQKDSVMFPDEKGMIFSGCGIIVDGEYCFPYTVAGTSTPWSDGKPFYQGLAKSFDKGETLVKMEEPFLGITGKDSRDPKIFWHEESSAYVMVLYLEGTSFGIYRSTDFKNWQETQRFTLELAWECPDLLKIPVEGGGYKWLFWSADGFYYWGDFDGYTFESDWNRHLAYLNDVPYAAQTYWGIKDRIVQMTWLRMERNGKNYNGAMAIPKVLTCKRVEDDYLLLQKPVLEYLELLEDSKEPVSKKPYSVDIYIGSDCEGVDLEINGSQVQFNLNSHKLLVDQSEFELPEKLESIQLNVDYNILELSIDNAIMAVYKTKECENSFSLNWRRNGNIKGCGSGVGADCYYSLKSVK